MIEMTRVHTNRTGNGHWSRRLFNQGHSTAIPSAPRHGTVSRENMRHRPGFSGNTHWSRTVFASAAKAQPRKNRLVVSRNREIVCYFELRSDQSEIFLGSDARADIILEGAKIAPFHAKFQFRQGKLRFQSLDAELPMYLDGKKVARGFCLDVADSSSLRVMAYQIRVELLNNRQLAACETNQAAVDSNPGENIKQVELQAAEIDGHLVQTASSASAAVPMQSWRNATTELKVVEIITESVDVKTFRLQGLAPLAFTYQPGQFITLALEIDGKKVQRSYSMSSSPSRPHTLDITVKRVPGGLVSNWLCDRIQVGDRLCAKGPSGRFTMTDDPAKKILLIGAGSGVTPLMSMTRWLFDTVSETDSKALFSFREPDDVIFAKEIDYMNSACNNIELAVTLTGSGAEHTADNRFSGRIDRELLKSWVPDLVERDVYLCGPEAFMASVKSALQDLNFPMDQLHSENFGGPKTASKSSTTAKPNAVPANDDNDRTDRGPRDNALHNITFTKSNKVITVDQDTNLLDAAEAEGIEIDSSCRNGSCAECMVKCLAGNARMDEDCEIDDFEREQGWIFSCCTFAQSDLTIDA